MAVLGSAAGFGYGLIHELADTPTALDWMMGVAFVVATAMTVPILNARTGGSHFWAVPVVTGTLCAAVVGDFVPFLLGLGDRSVNGYGQDTDWDSKWLLAATLAAFAFAGVVVGFAASLLSLLASLALETGSHDR